MTGKKRKQRKRVEEGRRRREREDKRGILLGLSTMPG